MADNTSSEVKSPCIGVCAVDELSGICQGCYRTIEEIQAWWDMGATAQKDLLTTLAHRQSASFDD